MRPELLTPNQLRIADLSATGRQIKEIADILGRSTQTIFNTLPKIYDRLGIPHNISALAVWRLCTLHDIALPDFIRKAGAMMLIGLFATTLTHLDDEVFRRSRRIRTREGIEETKHS